MFSAQTHYRKCKHLTECHSQGYCLSAVLAVHLHGADQAPKHNLPKKKRIHRQLPFSGRLPAPPGNSKGDIEGSVVQMSRWNLLVSPDDFLSHAPYYKSSALAVLWLKSYH